MVIPHRDSCTRASERRGPVAAALLAMAATVAVAGCSQKAMETGFSNQGWTQLQFYSPPGATVEVQTGPPRRHQISPESPFGNRLEQSPEECCVFNLAPGRYEFKYTSADGLPGVSLYGELVIYHANRHEARVFQRRSFVPISLPSEYYQRVEVAGDEIFPHRGEAYRTAIDELDLQRLAQGDVVEKVIFVADLERAEKLLDETERDIAACEREIEWADAKFRNAYLDFHVDVDDTMASLLRTDRRFIYWERKRLKLHQELEELEALRQRTGNLLDGDHVTDHPVVDTLNCLGVAGVVAALQAGDETQALFFRQIPRLLHEFEASRIDAVGFFHEDVLSRFDCRVRMERVELRRVGNKHDIR